jgi:hypothetical protein
MDAELENLLTGLEQLRTRLSDWMTSGPNEPASVRVGGVTAEATLASGLVSLDIDDYWLRTTDVGQVAECARQAIIDAEAACQSQIWQSLGDIRVGDFRVSDLSDSEKFKSAITPPEDLSSRADRHGH